MTVINQRLSWKTIHNKNSGNSALVVDGCSSDEAIANTFMRIFKRNSEPNNEEKVDALNAEYAVKLPPQSHQLQLQRVQNQSRANHGQHMLNEQWEMR